MHEAKQEKYLGDIITTNAKHAATVSTRRARGFGIISDITQILNHIQDSKRRTRVGLHLRQAWLINSILLNIEVWHNVLKKDTNIFLNLDHYLMRQITGAHSKVPVEFLYLETAAIPIDYILASRRVNYLHNILSKQDSELVKRVYIAQTDITVKGDWCDMVKMDMELIGLNMTESEIQSMSKNKFKRHVKKCMTTATFSALKLMQADHIKIKHIKYKAFKLQPYLQSGLFSQEEASTLFNLRANTVNGFKACFLNMHKNDIECKLGCTVEDTMAHSFQCKQLGTQSEISYDAIFANETQQKQAVIEFINISCTRSALLADRASQGHQVLDTSTRATARGAGSIDRGISSLPVDASCE